jgi:hypothetical protein
MSPGISRGDFLPYPKTAVSSEVDLVVEAGRPILFVEAKSGDADVDPSLRYLAVRFPGVPAYNSTRRAPEISSVPRAFACVRRRRSSGRCAEASLDGIYPEHATAADIARATRAGCALVLVCERVTRPRCQCSRLRAVHASVKVSPYAATRRSEARDALGWLNLEGLLPVK